MTLSRRFRRLMQLAAIAVVSLACSIALAQRDDFGDGPPREPPPRREPPPPRGDPPPPRERGPRPPGDPSFRGPHDEWSFVQGDYWLGLECFPVHEELRDQLSLPDGQGLVVARVSPDGPAAKADIKRHDILLAAGDKPLKDLRDLVSAVDDAKEKELTLKLMRAAKEITVKVTPVKRPRSGPAEDIIQKIQAALERGPAPLRMRIMHPGMFLPGGFSGAGGDFPEDLSVTIKKDGKKPAQVEAHQGDQSWKVSEDELDKLPEKIRGPVSSLLGRVDMLVDVDMDHSPGDAGPGGPRRPEHSRPPGRRGPPRPEDFGPGGPPDDGPPPDRGPPGPRGPQHGPGGPRPEDRGSPPPRGPEGRRGPQDLELRPSPDEGGREHPLSHFEIDRILRRADQREQIDQLNRRLNEIERMLREQRGRGDQRDRDPADD